MKSRGFTLLEVVLAITVLTVAVGASFALIQQTLVAASINQSKLVAYYLAQEGVELVRNIRDSNWLKQRILPLTSWREGLDAGLFAADYLYPPSHGFVEDPLNITEAGFYGYFGGTPTPFKRIIYLNDIDVDSMEVVVEVSWEERGREHAVEVADRLYNWYGY